MKKKLSALVLFLCSACTFLHSQEPWATVKEYNKSFVTYPFSDPNPVPVVGSIYPYFRFDMFTNTPVNKEWKVVELENPYLRVMILPEVGGKIWAAIDKASGRSFIYYNEVVKFRDIAMRGPWTSGGIEANYGIIGHTPNCATPVDYITMKKEDGSVSCVIGVLDLLTRTPWRLEINLPPDKAFFTTTSLWQNTTPLEQPYYTWMNVGIKAAGNLEFIFPGNRYLGHGGEYGSWPVNPENKQDISWYENNNFGGYKSYHVFGKYTDFYGGYWHDEDFGMGRYATHDDKAGKKIWIWGLSQQGMIWEKLLTDADGQYVEVQSGRLFNQSAASSTFTPFKHAGFQPYATDRWTEYWFPVKQTKGFVSANPFGALNVTKENGQLWVRFMALQQMNDSLKVFEKEKEIFSAFLALSPLQLFNTSLKIPQDMADLKVILGGNKMVYEAGPQADVLKRPVDMPHDFDWNTAYGLYLQGKELSRQHDYASAQEKWLASLEKDPYFLPSLTEMSMLMCRWANYTKALEYATTALSIDTYDPEANYCYGLANEDLAQVTDARDGFDIASLSPSWRSAACTELAKLYFHEHEYERAAEYASKSLVVNQENLSALQILAAAYRKRGDQTNFQKTVDHLLSLDPLDHVARFEKYLVGEKETDLHDFSSLIRNEMPWETFLEMACWYHELGMDEECLKLLALAPPNAEISYWKAFICRQDLKGDWQSFLAEGNTLPARMVFPFRRESIDVFTWAMRETNCWKPRYYLGLLYWHLNKTDSARDLFLQCGNIPDYAPFYAARATLLAGTDPQNSLADLLKAAQLEPGEWRYGMALARFYIDKKEYAEALKTASSYQKMLPGNYLVEMMYARSLLLNGQYKKCTDILASINLLPSEGATDARQLHHEAQLRLAIEQMKVKNYKKGMAYIEKARLYPENLGAGQPYPEDRDERLEDWLAYQCLKQQNRIHDAAKLLEKIEQFTIRYHSVNSLVSSWAWKEAGYEEKGRNILQEWNSREPTNPLARWCLDVYIGQPAENLDFPGDENARIIQTWIHNTK